MQHMQDPQMQQHQQPFGIIPDGSAPDAGSNLTDEQQIAQQIAQSRNGMQQLGNVGRRGGDPQGGSSRTSIDGSYAGMSNNNLPPGTNPLLANTLSNGQNHHSYNQITEHAGNGNSLHPNASHQSQTQPHERTTMAVFGMQDASANVWSQIYQQPSQHQQQTYFTQPYPQNPHLVQVKSEHTQQQPPQQPQPYQPPIKQEHPAFSYSQIKPEPNPHVSLLAGVYPGVPHITNPVQDFPNWNFQNDPLKTASDSLIIFCNLPDRPTSNKMRHHLSPDNIKHFLERFSSFHGHFPIIHMPSFRIAETYTGLVLGMVCIGAVYSSDRISPSDIREMMEIAKAAIEIRSSVYNKAADSTLGKGSIGQNAGELEQISALHLMHLLFTWNGTPEQREEARRQLPFIVSLCRKAGMLQPTSTGAYSVLHQPRFTMDGFSLNQFDWPAWIEQEKRSRLMYIIFLADAANVLYFNSPPLFQLFEVQLPLPADDAAWDAKSGKECMEALGLMGPPAARDRNPEGSRRWRQPEMHSAMRALLHDTYDLLPGTTNLYSKFVLIHALHVQLWLAQRQIAQGSTQTPPPGSTTPMAQHDWVRTMDSSVTSAPPSNAGSGRATPVNDGAQSLKDTNRAFDKWKKAWDDDMLVQYPPPPRSYRRFGFCRDAVHFYYLAKCLLQNNQALDNSVAPDQRFSHIMQLLAYVKQWVVSDSAKRGEELGSVNDISSEYAITDLTLNMSKLFKPYNRELSAPPGAGIDTSAGSRYI